MSEKTIEATIERRYIPAEVRADDEGRIEGYAAVFDQWAEIWNFKEKVRAGAFKKTIEESDIRALFNHNSNYVLGRKKAGTLELAEDDHGLHFRTTPPSTDWTSGLLESIQRGDVDGASFSFDVVADEWHSVDGNDERELIEVRLYDVGPVTFPAYPQTSVSVRALGNIFISGLRKIDDPELVQEMRTQLEAFEKASGPGQELHPKASAEDEPEPRSDRPGQESHLEPDPEAADAHNAVLRQGLEHKLKL